LNLLQIPVTPSEYGPGSAQYSMT